MSAARRYGPDGDQEWVFRGGTLAARLTVRLRPVAPVLVWPATAGVGWPSGLRPRPPGVRGYRARHLPPSVLSSTPYAETAGGATPTCLHALAFASRHPVGPALPRQVRSTPPRLVEWRGRHTLCRPRPCQTTNGGRRPGNPQWAGGNRGTRGQGGAPLRDKRVRAARRAGHRFRIQTRGEETAGIRGTHSRGGVPRWPS